MSHFAVECNFVPARAPHEIVNKVSGQRLVDRINIWLTRYALKTGLHMMAKLDPHHNVYEDDMTWNIEIVPVTKFHLDWVKQWTPSHFAFLSAMDGLITAMRDKFGLVTEVIRRKGRVETHHSIGGLHVHRSADLYGFTTDWYRLMERFHRDLATDYANRPYIRWLLAHWMGEGSRVVIDRHRLEQRAINGAGLLTRDDIFSRALFNASAIEPRFMASTKNSYLTFEFRFVGMVQNATQMCAAVRLIDAWVRHHVERTYAKRKPIQFNLTLARWDEMATPEGARQHCREWVESLGLDWADYERDFFERNYLMRIAHGKME
jgi:hypothetical protein